MSLFGQLFTQQISRSYVKRFSTEVARFAGLNWKLPYHWEMENGSGLESQGFGSAKSMGMAIDRTQCSHSLRLDSI